jgi:hypothetical protein
MTGTLRTLTVGSIAPGLNNRAPDFKLAAKDGSFVRAAVNVDITQEGTAKRRRGYEQLVAGTSCHSFWSDDFDAYYADGGSLFHISGLPTTPVATTLRNDLVPGRPVSYARGDDGQVYYSNGVVIGRVLSTALSDVAPPLFTVTPGVAGAAGGALPAGAYTVCLTQVAADGRESGSTMPVQVDVPANGRIDITGMPAAFPAGVAAISIYVSSVNDGTPLRAFVLETAAASFSVTVSGAAGGRCMTTLMVPMPAGDVVRYHRGRLFVATGSTLFYSEPYAPGMHNAMRGFISLPATITVVEPCVGGVWVCADRTYWLGNDMSALVPVLPYGAIAGTGVRVPDDQTVSWMSTQGLVIGNGQGEAANVQEDRVVTNNAAAGATLYVERDGMRQMVSSLFGVGTDTGRAAAATYMEAEVIRKGTTL